MKITLAECLKSRRAELGKSLREIAARSSGKISNGYLSQLENGRCATPSVYIVYILAEILELRASELFECAREKGEAKK